jgi:hypothetical protein
VAVGDLDGDGAYDFVVKTPAGGTDPWDLVWKPAKDTHKLEAYSSTGRFLWRRDLGWNIEMGIWYSPFIVADLDGDGKAEVIAKTAPLAPDFRDPDGRVQRGPETESGGRVHTTTATVAVLPEVDEVEFELDPADIEMQVFRASGAGGQHINKTSSAVRLLHKPTGTVVECQQERSQFQNREKAMQILRSRLYEAEQEKIDSEFAAARRSQVGSGMRNERIRTYNFPQGRLTDHRIGLTLYKLDAVMNGDLDEIIDGLITQDQAEKMKSFGEEE